MNSDLLNLNLFLFFWPALASIHSHKHGHIIATVICASYLLLVCLGWMDFIIIIIIIIVIYYYIVKVSEGFCPPLRWGCIEKAHFWPK